MWYSSVILLIFKLIYVNGDGIWKLYQENADNSNIYKGDLWNFGGEKISNVDLKGLTGSEKKKNVIDTGFNNNKNIGDKFETGVSIGYHERMIGKELRVNEEEVTNEDNFVRPCPFDDWECIRKFFAHNSDCKPVYGPAPDPLYNKKTRDLVFAIQVTNLNETTPKGIFTYRRTTKESIVLADFATILFKDLVFTAVIPKIPKLRLDLAEIHVDIREERPVDFVGPKAYTSKDPDVIKAYADFVAFLPIIVREGVFYQAPLFTSSFIQKNVCDFGIKLNSV